MIMVKPETRLSGVTCRACGAHKKIEGVPGGSDDLKLAELHIGHANTTHVTTLCTSCLGDLHQETRPWAIGSGPW